MSLPYCRTALASERSPVLPSSRHNQNAFNESPRLNASFVITIERMKILVCRQVYKHPSHFCKLTVLYGRLVFTYRWNVLVDWNSIRCSVSRRSSVLDLMVYAGLKFSPYPVQLSRSRIEPATADSFSMKFSFVYQFSRSWPLLAVYSSCRYLVSDGHRMPKTRIHLLFYQLTPVVL